MSDEDKTKEQLIGELKELRLSVSKLKESEKSLKRAEETLKEEAIRLKLLVEQSRDGIVVLDENGKVFDANIRYAEMLGYTMDEVSQLHVWDWDVMVSRETIMGMIRNVDEVGDHFVTRHRRKDGTFLDVEISTNGAICGGQKLVFCVCRDITERKRFEEQLRNASKMEALGTLVGGIAHEFNNILAIIMGNADISLSDCPESSPAHFHLEQIKTASIRARDVVKQLLSYIRKIDYKRKPLNLIPVVKDSIKFLRATIPSNIDIQLNITAFSDVVLADPTQINQVLINLCTNSFHALEATGGELVIDMRNIVKENGNTSIDPELSMGNYVKLTIRDTGEGIPPQIIDRIFDPFFTTKEVGKGSGMGLSVVHGIIKSYNGAISVESQLGEGTTVSLYFPVIEGEVKPESKSDDIAPMGSERILFVDDERFLVNMAQRMLERLGYEVEAKTSPEEALDLFCADPGRFDIVITDMMMPVLTGDILAKKILAVRPGIPVILCTGYSEKILEENAAEIGIRAFLAKPLAMRDLAVTLRQVLDR